MTAASIGPAAPPAAPRPAAYLFHPVLDWMLLGGASLFVLPFMHLVSSDVRPSLVLGSFALADFINHPHFLHSYLIFYRGFGKKLSPGHLSPSLRARYAVAGILVPILLLGLLLGALFAGDAHVLGLGGNVMTLFVGWHYVKQGYGMAILESVLKRRFFSERDKTILRVNGYACWVLYWLLANHWASESELWGLSYYAIDPPVIAIGAGAVIAAGTTVAALALLAQRWRAGTLPTTGAVVYLVSVYLWLFGRLDPGVLIFIPVFHSLQYLIVVFRMELNRARGEGADPARQVIALYVLAGMLGYLGFWALPRWADAWMPFDREALGVTPFLFVSWIFLNVHHYFIDNVIWRSENPDTKANLFSPAPAKA
jgi:hypothetical protein